MSSLNHARAVAGWMQDRHEPVCYENDESVQDLAGFC